MKHTRVLLQFEELNTIGRVAAVLGGAAPWFDPNHPTHFLDKVYPSQVGSVRGAFVVERTPPPHDPKVKLGPGQRERDRGLFRILWITLDGDVHPVGKTYNKRNSATYAASSRAAGTWEGKDEG